MALVEDILKQGLSIRTKTEGASMLPFIRRGDYVTIQPASVNNIRVGDIVAYTKDGQGIVICHRLLKIKDATLVTKGDTRFRGYETIPLHSLLGKVISIEHKGSKLNIQTDFQRFLAPKIAWVSLNLPLCLLIIAYFIEALSAPYLVPKKLIRKLIVVFTNKRVKK